jgi:hypothetical protein
MIDDGSARNIGDEKPLHPGEARVIRAVTAAQLAIKSPFEIITV